MRLRSLKMIVRFSALAMLALLVLAACQGPPPTQYVIITSTPTGGPQIITATLEPAQATLLAEVQGTLTATFSVPGASPTATLTTQATQTETETDAESTRRPRRPTATLDPVPTPTISQIQVAEQLFEKGRLFWLQPINQIWVMVETSPGSGLWTVYDDKFVEGDVEFDPDIIAPTGLFQPERGFGLIWRSNDEVRSAVGWALEPEVGHVSNYEYRPAGELIDGKFESQPGYHILSSTYGEVFRFNEINGTWQTIETAEPSN